MDRLVYTISQKEIKVGDKTHKVPEYVFQIQGKEEDYTSEEVDFKVFDLRNKLIARDKSDAAKVVNESVFFTAGDIRKDSVIADRLGGNACGRVFPAFEGLKKFDPVRAKEEKDKAGWYTFLFGEVTFPGQAPVLVNLRLTGRLGMEFAAVEKVMGRDKAEWPSNLIGMKAKELSGKPQFVDLEFEIKETDLDTDGNEESTQAVADFIQAHNINITQGNQ